MHGGGDSPDDRLRDKTVEMRIVVQKYGGSSVADLEKLSAVADRIGATQAQGFSVLVVVSAMGNTTDELIGLAHQVSEDPDRRELDMLISVGERITMSLLAMALRDRGIAARSLTGSQSGIITDESHADASVVEVRPGRVREALESGVVVIVAGFQGVSRAREITTLGRGGSDTTAVVLAAALGAEYCEICSDVDGVWSADPRRVPASEKLDAIGLDQALALARGGAKVLFEDAVRFARDAGIQVVASSTFGPGSGTRLEVDHTLQTVPGAVAGAIHQEIDLGDRSFAEVGARVIACGGRVRRRVGSIIHVDLSNVHGEISSLPERARVLGKVAVITVVGSAFAEHFQLIGCVEAELHQLEIDVRRSGASGDTAWWQVHPSRLDDAVRAAHSALAQCTSKSSMSTSLGPEVP